NSVTSLATRTNCSLRSAPSQARAHCFQETVPRTTWSRRHCTATASTSSGRTSNTRCTRNTHAAPPTSYPAWPRSTCSSTRSRTHYTYSDKRGHNTDTVTSNGALDHSLPHRRQPAPPVRVHDRTPPGKDGNRHDDGLVPGTHPGFRAAPR